jgi:hypothetical protein
MSIKQIIQESINKNPVGLKEALEEELRSRVAAALEEMVNKEVEEDLDLSDYTTEELEDFMMSEDFEQLDEISKKTLASYVSKAADNAASHGIKYGEKRAHSDEMDRMMNRHMSYSDKDKVRQIMKTTSNDIEAPREKAAKRLKGIDMAVKKLSR